MICITGAGGTVGSELVRQLTSENVAFRSAHFSKKKVEDARSRGMDAVMIDYSNPETLRSAFDGCDTLFLLGPSAIEQTKFEISAVDAAKDVGITHIVKLSVMGAADESYSLANIHRPVEKSIEASGLSWTFLRPCGFMQNTVTFMSETINAESVFYSACGQANISHVDVRDIASVAVRVLKTPGGHNAKAYTLTGPEALSYDDIASELSNVLGRTIRHISLPPEDLKQGMLAAGTPELLADVLIDLERYYREDQASLITSDIQNITGKSPVRFADFARDIAATGVWNLPHTTDS